MNERTKMQWFPKFRSESLSHRDEPHSGLQLAFNDKAFQTAIRKDSSLTCGEHGLQINVFNETILKKHAQLRYDVRVDQVGSAHIVLNPQKTTSGSLLLILSFPVTKSWSCATLPINPSIYSHPRILSPTAQQITYALIQDYATQVIHY